MIYVCLRIDIGSGLWLSFFCMFIIKRNHKFVIYSKQDKANMFFLVLIYIHNWQKNMKQHRIKWLYRENSSKLVNTNMGWTSFIKVKIFVWPEFQPTSFSREKKNHCYVHSLHFMCYVLLMYWYNDTYPLSHINPLPQSALKLLLFNTFLNITVSILK